MKDEFYKITKKLGVEQLKDFIPNTLPEDIFCVLKRVHHQTNQSQAGNLYSYYKYEFLDVIGNGIQFTIRDTVLVLSSEEFWVINGLPFNMRIDIKDSEGVVKRYDIQGYSHWDLMHKLIHKVYLVGRTFTLGDIKKSGHAGYEFYTHYLELLDRLLRLNHINEDLYRNFKNFILIN